MVGARVRAQAQDRALNLERMHALHALDASALRRLSEARVCVLGLGSLGSEAAQVLMRSGIGSLVLVDRDIVEPHNLSVSTLYGPRDVGLPKAVAARRRLARISQTRVDAFTLDVVAGNISRLRADLIIDATDNLETRFLLNEFARKEGIPWVHGSVIDHRGFVCLFTHGDGEGCLRCFLPRPKELTTCTSQGVWLSAVDIVASLQCYLGLNFLAGNRLEYRAARVDLQRMRMDPLHVPQNPTCGVCQGDFPLLGDPQDAPVSFCSASVFQVRVPQMQFAGVRRKLRGIDKVRDLGSCFLFRELVVFDDGRVLVRCDSVERARSLVAQYIGT